MLFTEKDREGFLFREDLPKYKRIANLIREKIQSGELTIGEKLPPQRAMATFFHVNRSTIVEAMDELKSYGILSGDSTKGTYIMNNTWSLLMAREGSNWSPFVKSGTFRANKSTIQDINRLEYEDGIIRLGTGEFSPDLFPREEMREILNRVSENYTNLNYLGPLGLPELRAALVQHLQRYGINTTAENILIVSGSIQALQLISVGLLRPGAPVLMEDPSYLNSLQIFQSAGMQLLGIPMDSEGIQMKSLHSVLGSTTSPILYTIPCFQNPTGTVMSHSRRMALLQEAVIQHLPIIEDDCYRDLWFDKAPPPPLRAYAGGDSTLYLGSVSKALSPGLRLGWVVGPKAVVERLGDIKMQMDYGASSISQWILTEWLESGLYYKHLEVLRPKLMARRDFLLRLLNEHFTELAEWTVPTGGFYIWLKLKKSIPMDTLFEMALKKNLLINPGNLYEFERKSSIRLSYSFATEAQYEYGLPILGEIIRHLMTFSS